VNIITITELVSWYGFTSHLSHTIHTTGHSEDESFVAVKCTATDSIKQKLNNMCTWSTKKNKHKKSL